ncbi:MAG: hypothetical protein K2L77_03515 [Muribaculaceae bacterium]|nr:hypothetical protein [Muribaculaceae bacterium]
MGLSRWYKRWRHGHGYGVHSPYAYRMVREVLRPPHGYAYYAEYSLPHAELRLLYRLLMDLRPLTVAVAAGAQADMLRQLVRLALPTACITDSGTPDMLIVHGNADVWPEAAGAGIVYLNNAGHPLLAEAAARLDRGHIYRNPSRALIVRNTKLPAQIFEVKF